MKREAGRVDLDSDLAVAQLDTEESDRGQGLQHFDRARRKLAKPEAGECSTIRSGSHLN